MLEFLDTVSESIIRVAVVNASHIVYFVHCSECVVSWALPLLTTQRNPQTTYLSYQPSRLWKIVSGAKSAPSALRGNYCSPHAIPPSVSRSVANSPSWSHDQPVTTHLTPQCLEKGHARMSRDLADETALFIKVHSLKVRVVAGENLVGFRDNPDLGICVNHCFLSRVACMDVPRSCHLR